MDYLCDKLEWFKSVILPHEGALRARLRSLRQKPENLDDLVAEVLLRAYSDAAWRGVEWGRAYLFTIARNLLIDQLRRAAIVSFDTAVDLDQLQSNVNLEAQLTTRDQLRYVERVIASMPPQAARVFIARRIEQKTPGQIAEEMHLSVSTVEKHLHKAIRLLMRAMAEQEASGVEQERSEHEGSDRATGR